jgi:hypothetical protein
MWRDDPAAGATGQGSLHAARAGVRARATGRREGRALLSFAREGCWKITGRSGADVLSFVAYLIDELRR